MGRKDENPCRDYFIIDKEKGESKCNVGLCTTILSGKNYNHAGNMESHLNNKHKELKDEIAEKKRKIESSAKRKNQGQDGTVPSKKIKIQMDSATLKKACVEMVTTNGRPFKAMNDSGFRRIIEPIIEGLNEEEPLIINSHTVRQLTIDEACAYRATLRQELKGKLISLKLDCCTRLDRSILGVNYQFVDDDGKINLRTLAMKEIFVRHTSENLKQMVYDILLQYEIPIENVYSTSTDNGANVLKLVKLMAIDQADCVSL